MVNLNTDRNRLLVSFTPYSDALYKDVKALGGGRFDEKLRAWKFPLTRLDDVLRVFPNHWKEPRLAKYMEFVKRQEALRALADAPQPLGIVVPLKRLQRVAVGFLAQLPRAVMLSKGVGVGKTLCGIAWAASHMETEGRRGVLVVTKSAGKYPYRDEIHKLIPGTRVGIINGERGPFPTVTDCDWCILNWDLLHSRLGQIRARNFSAVVFSESHKAKSSKTLRGDAALEISHEIPNVLLETASFTPNRNAEAFPQLCIVGLYDKDDDWFSFHYHYCIDPAAPKVVINRRGATRWDFSHSLNSEELHRAMAPFTFVIDRKELLPDLPEPYFTPVLVDPPNMATCKAAETDFLAWVRQEKGEAAAQRVTRTVEVHKRSGEIKKISKPLVIAKINALLGLAAEGNVEAAEDYIETCLEAGEKVLVFSSFKKPLHKLLDRFPAVSVLITGDESAKEKDVAREAFQNSPAIRICLCSTEAGGESITLTAATTVIFLSLPWSPDTFAQAYGRTDRYGQTRSVNVIVLIGRKTWQVEQVEMLYAKQLDISKVVSGSDRSPNSDALRQILAEVKGEEVKDALFPVGV